MANIQTNTQATHPAAIARGLGITLERHPSLVLTEVLVPVGNSQSSRQ